MIRRIHDRAAKTIAAGLFTFAVAMSASASGLVSQSEMRSFVYWTLAVVLFAVVGSAAAFFSYLLSRVERSFDAAVERLEANLKAERDAHREHLKDEQAHPGMNEHAHAPLLRHLMLIEGKLDALIDEHNAIRAREDDISCLLKRRDPMKSIDARRETDPPGFDGRPLRGKP